MVHLILTGATGLVGSAVLHHMLNAPAVTAVSILSRRPVPQAEGHPKARVIIHKDYTTYPPELLDQLKGAEGVVWAQGMSVTQVTKDEYEQITYVYPLAAARAFGTLSSPFKFVYVSGEGATPNPSFLTAHFGVVKGRAEAALLALSKESEYSSIKPYSVRPGGVDAGQHHEIHAFMPKRTGVTKVTEATLLPAIKRLYPSAHSPTRELGRVLTELAMGDGRPLEGKGVLEEGRTVSNVGLRRLAGL